MRGYFSRSYIKYFSSNFSIGFSRIKTIQKFMADGHGRFVFKAPKGATRDELKQLAKEQSGDPNYELPEEFIEKWIEASKHEREKAQLVKEIAGECGQRDDHSNKKKQEITLIANFLFDIGYKAKIVACDERPDFIVEIEGEKIGVELTGIFDTNVVASINGFQKKLDEAAEAIRDKDSDFKGLFNFTIDPAKVVLRNKGLVNELVACVEAKREDKVLPKIDGVTLITDTRHEVLELVVSEQYNLGDVDLDNVKQTIKKKEDKFLEYKGNTGLNKFWLLIAFDGASAKGSFKFDIQRLPTETATQFDKVFFYDEMKKTIIFGQKAAENLDASDDDDV